MLDIGVDGLDPGVFLESEMLSELMDQLHIGGIGPGVLKQVIAARELLRRHQMSHPSVEEIVAKTGACRSRAYELKGELLRTLPTLLPNAQWRPNLP